LFYCYAYYKEFKKLPKELVLFTLKKKEIIKIIPTVEDMNVVEDKIWEIYKKMNERKFLATPSHEKCSHCSFASLCPSSILDLREINRMKEKSLPEITIDNILHPEFIILNQEEKKRNRESNKTKGTGNQ